MKRKSSGSSDHLHDSQNKCELNSALVTQELFMKDDWSRKASRDESSSVRWGHQLLVI